MLLPGTVGAQPAAAPAVLKRVGIDQKLDAQVPLDLVFRDESGRSVKLGDFFGDKPVVLALVYYECPMLCTMTLNGMLRSFKPLKFDVGKDFQVVTVSFDPRETPQLAARKKKSYLAEYARPGAAAGWHFLTGDAAAIAQLTAAVGFRYTFDEPSQQFAHGSAIMVLTPQGRISKYFYGLDYAPKDLRLGLVEASAGKIGSLADAVLLLCYHYDPMTGKYGLAIMNTLRAGGLLTVAALGAFVFFMIRRERKKNGPSPQPSPLSTGARG